MHNARVSLRVVVERGPPPPRGEGGVCSDEAAHSHRGGLLCAAVPSRESAGATHGEYAGVVGARREVELRTARRRRQMLSILLEERPPREAPARAAFARSRGARTFRVSTLTSLATQVRHFIFSPAPPPSSSSSSSPLSRSSSARHACPLSLTAAACACLAQILHQLARLVSATSLLPLSRKLLQPGSPGRRGLELVALSSLDDLSSVERRRACACARPQAVPPRRPAASLSTFMRACRARSGSLRKQSLLLGSYVRRHLGARLERQTGAGAVRLSDGPTDEWAKRRLTAFPRRPY